MKMGGVPSKSNVSTHIILVGSNIVRILGTEQKIEKIRDELNKLKITFTQGCNVINIHRNTIFDDSFKQFLDHDHQ